MLGHAVALGLDEAREVVHGVAAAHEVVDGVHVDLLPRARAELHQDGRVAHVHDRALVSGVQHDGGAGVGVEVARVGRGLPRRDLRVPERHDAEVGQHDAVGEEVRAVRGVPGAGLAGDDCVDLAGEHENLDEAGLVRSRVLGLPVFFTCKDITCLADHTVQSHGGPQSHADASHRKHAERYQSQDSCRIEVATNATGRHPLWRPQWSVLRTRTSK